MRFEFHISTKNRKEDLLITLSQIYPLLGPDAGCVVFDDGSHDGTFESVAARFPDVLLLRNESSRGYLYCRNQMLNRTQATYAISLDDDAHFLSADPLRKIDQFFESHPTAGLLAFRIFWGLQPPESESTQLKQEVVKSFVGCGHAWRVSAWKSIPDYPEWFEFYGEENVASMDLFLNGWQVWYVPEVLVWHRVNIGLRSKATGDKQIRERRSLRSGWYAYGLFFPADVAFFRWFKSAALQLKKVISGHPEVLRTVGGAVTDVIRHLPQMLRERRKMNKAQFRDFRSLSDAKIFWKPESSVKDNP